ncbi:MULTISPECIES: helicase HerA-like domain-containing protein [unclassified Brevundimonas]|uniref:helicase HerA-like domain-containing protein n=1 Tax=unclassified Brevundimonas TaxID=2622653 RepID=UPI000CFDA1BA|nr:MULTISPECIES: helicase HerA-like domain-containing protein [unclassified Brevundimonas]PRA36582.1 ATP-binding protein [Brevundimonas sp. MYb27]PQZ78664.1 ATP-binding protein [Brevundimonas sp. MYb31]PRB13558.1 ATP-binding protein [Brevundimonas sp. MYb52]PRB34226.1 ATP-binding protein [Brevundimonas sp. MYb46]PRB46620.1 ATP-binding protein [Brevundimonas sp. MYb33]
MTDTPAALFLGQSFEGAAENLLFKRANRHGVVAGATGTGKTVTLQIMAQGFSDAGVPVFCADVKGDLSGISQSGDTAKFGERAGKMGLTLTGKAAPVVFWDLYGQKGHPVRATVSDIGPTLLARMLELNDVQEGVLTVAFHVADKEGLLLLDLEDLRALLAYVGENAQTIGREVGNVSPTSIAAIQRALLQLEQQGGDAFFGEPALRLEDMMRTSLDGRGQVNVLDSTRLMNSPRLYAAFLLWLLSELFEQLPEIGDPEKPRLVFFFDEAHLLFNDAPKGLLEKVEQVVRLIRSKGVGVYFVTQNPADIPDTVLAQLGNRVQHALRAYTPAEQKGLRAAAQSFRTNPSFDTAEAIQGLGVGEALVSTLDDKGAPTVVAQTKIRPPDSRLGPATEAERAAIMAASPVRGTYDTAVNRESAEEVLKARRAQADRIEAQAQADALEAKAAEKAARSAPAPARERAAPRARASSSRQTPMEALTKSVLRTAGSTITRELLRGVLGSLKRR